MKLIGVVGLGYVGLPLVAGFAKHYNVIGYDLSSERIEALKKGKDLNRQISDETLKKVADKIIFTCDKTLLAEADVIIIAVPTPVTIDYKPDFRAIIRATQDVGAVLKKGAIVVFESTVYPGATEEICIPALEKNSGLQWKKDFWVGYSPERINPCDPEHTLEKVTKLVAGDLQKTRTLLFELYSKVALAGVYEVPSIKIAEAAKVIENTQRDINIALMNELAMIFQKLHIDMREVLNAAATKWNFLSFKPGLVGGHCIGVDPYYLTYKAEQVGYNPQIILAGRFINNAMGKYIAEKAKELLLLTGKDLKHSTVNILGLAFKENCSDTRNTRVVDVIETLIECGVEVNVCDPLADKERVLDQYNYALIKLEHLPPADAVILAVAHEDFLKISIDQWQKLVKAGGWILDVKSKLNATDFKDASIQFWQL